jgi:hypothetical protein
MFCAVNTCGCGIDLPARLPMVVMGALHARIHQYGFWGFAQVIKPLIFGFTINPASRQDRQTNMFSKS